MAGQLEEMNVLTDLESCRLSRSLGLTLDSIFCCDSVLLNIFLSQS